MTVEERYVVDVRDLTTIRFECTSERCGVVVTMPVEGFPQPPTHCPGCHTEWFPTRMTSQDEQSRDFAVRQLVGTLRALRKLGAETGTPFRIRLEVDLPDTSA